MRWVIDQRGPTCAWCTQLLAYGRQRVGRALHLTALGHDPVGNADAVVGNPLAVPAADVLLEPAPLLNEPEPLAGFFTSHVRRWASVATWPQSIGRSTFRTLVWLRRYHTIQTPDADQGRALLGPNAAVRTLSPEAAWHELWRPTVPPPTSRPAIVLIAELACHDAAAHHTRQLAQALAPHAMVELLSEPTTENLARLACSAATRLFVLADAPAHAWVRDWHARLGGALLLHGEYLGHLWYGRYGLAATATGAARELKRPVPLAEARLWLLEPATCPVSFFAGADQRAPVLFVPSAAVAQRYANALSFAERAGGTMPHASALPVDGAGARRETPAQLLFDTAAPEAMQALDLLQAWHVPFRATWFGRLTPTLRQLARRYDVPIREERRATWAAALRHADVAVVLRDATSGGLAAAVTASVQAGVPCVVRAAEARLGELPASVRWVPDRLSPLLLAEALQASLTCTAQPQPMTTNVLTVLRALGFHEC